MITVAPVALLVGRKSGLSKASVLLAMLGGAKAGNVMSPNPNTIAIANGFHTDLSKVMLEGSLPAIVAIVITFFIAHKLRDKGDTIHKNALNLTNDNLPSFKLSIIGPVVVIILLALNSILHLQIDSMIILPLGGLIAAVCMG
ncbi:GntT/GntP/DsdX family permease, partial [Porphyromonas levii]